MRSHCLGVVDDRPSVRTSTRGSSERARLSLRHVAERPRVSFEGPMERPVAVGTMRMLNNGLGCSVVIMSGGRYDASPGCREDDDGLVWDGDRSRESGYAGALVLFGVGVVSDDVFDLVASRRSS